MKIIQFKNINSNIIFYRRFSNNAPYGQFVSNLFGSVPQKEKDLLKNKNYIPIKIEFFGKIINY